MSRKPETTFIGSVHKHLPKELHREKMNNPYSSGTADVWYSGNKADLWIEYKFIPRIPARDTTLIGVDLSTLQKEWLHNREREGRSVCVIVGCPEGGVMLEHLRWESDIYPHEFRERLMSRVELANLITSLTMR